MRTLTAPMWSERFIVVPPNPRNFKYATRQFGDDDALEIIEATDQSVSTLQRWATPRRIGMLDSIGCTRLLASSGRNADFSPVFRTYSIISVSRRRSRSSRQTEAGAEIEAKDAIFAFLAGERTPRHMNSA